MGTTDTCYEKFREQAAVQAELESIVRDLAALESEPLDGEFGYCTVCQADRLSFRDTGHAENCAYQRAVNWATKDARQFTKDPDPGRH